MKIEGYGQQKVGPQSVRAPVGQVLTPRDHMRGALAQVDQFGGQVVGVVAKAQTEAETIEARDSLNELEKRGTARWAGDTTGILPARAGDITTAGTPREGFTATRGLTAAEKSAKVMEDFDGDIQELSGKLKSERARKIFTAEAASRRQGLLNRVEGHVANETERAKVDSIKVATANAVREAVMSPADDEVAGERIASASAAAAEMASSPEAAQAQAVEIQAQVSRARLDQLLANTDVEAAERVLGANRKALGVDADRYDKAITAQKADVVADRAARTAAAGAMDPRTGRINDAKALELLEQQELTPAARQKAAERLDHKIVVNEKAWKERVSNGYDSAFSTYLRTRSLDNVPVTTREWLIEHAPAKWDELMQKEKRDREYAKKLLRGENNEGETAAERYALLELKSDIVRNPDKYANMTPAEFNTEWGARLSPSGYKSGSTAFAETSKGDRVGNDEFSSYVNQLIQTNPHLHASDKSETAEKRVLADGFRADFHEARRAFKEEKKRSPSLAEIQAPEFQKAIWSNMLKRSNITLTQPAMQLPELDLTDTPPIPAAKPSKGARAKELKAQGLSNADIAARMTTEGY